MKHIITNGCSFTRQFRRLGITGTADDFMDDHISQWKWPHFIQEENPDLKVLNYACPIFSPIGSKKEQAWHVLMEKYIPHTWESDIKSQYSNKPYIKYVYNLIDLDKFWFYKKENTTKFGGQVEWCIQNYDYSEISDREDVPNLIWQEYRTP